MPERARVTFRRGTSNTLIAVTIDCDVFTPGMQKPEIRLRIVVGPNSTDATITVEGRTQDVPLAKDGQVESFVRQMIEGWTWQELLRAAAYWGQGFDVGSVQPGSSSPPQETTMPGPHSTTATITVEGKTREVDIAVDGQVERFIHHHMIEGWTWQELIEAEDAGRRLLRRSRNPRSARQG